MYPKFDMHDPLEYLGISEDNVVLLGMISFPRVAAGSTDLGSAASSFRLVRSSSEDTWTVRQTTPDNSSTVSENQLRIRSWFRCYTQWAAER